MHFPRVGVALACTALAFAAPISVSAIIPATTSSNRSLFVFHTGPQNCSHDCAWQQYPWASIHTILMFESYPRLAAYARAAGANVGVSLGMPEDLGNATSRRQTIQAAISSCRALPGCNTLNIDIESAIANASAQSHQLTTFVAELADAAK